MPKSKNRRKPAAKNSLQHSVSSEVHNDDGASEPVITRRGLFGALALLGGGGALYQAGSLSSLFGGGGDVEFLEYTHDSTDTRVVAQDFMDLVARESKDRFVLVDFHAEWCGPCRVMSPNLVPGAEASGEDVLVIKAVTEDRFRSPTNLIVARDVMEQEGYYPELQIYKDGGLVAYHSGLLSVAEVADFIEHSADGWREIAPELSNKNEGATFG